MRRGGAARRRARATARESAATARAAFAPAALSAAARAALQAGIDAMLAARAEAVAAQSAQASPNASQRKARSEAAAAEAASIDASAALICEHASTKVRAARVVLRPLALRCVSFASFGCLLVCKTCFRCALTPLALQFTQAAECYDMVDLHIRRLDKDLALFDKEVARLGGGGDSPDRAAAMAAAMAAAGGKPSKSHAKRSGKSGATQQLLSCTHAMAASLTGCFPNSHLTPFCFSLRAAPPLLPVPTPRPGGAAAAALAAGGQLGGGLLSRAELAVDPNEPLYCSCQRVSFGDMVACEAETCPIEWFHYECVGALCL